MAELSTFFSGNYIDRLGEIRNDSETLNAALMSPMARFLPIFRERCLIQGDYAAMLTRDEVRPRIGDLSNAIFLGRLAEKYIFAVDWETDDDPGFVDAANQDFRVREDSAVLKLPGWEKIPIERIGLYNDEYRGN